ncbi:MAG: 2OG-Fe(II) oxygenase [Sediminibacterium sp.]
MNKIRYTEDIVIYENFLTLEDSTKVIQVLNKQFESKKLSWTPISFYESYSSVLPQDNDPELEEFGLAPTFFSDLKSKIIDAVASVHGLDSKTISQIGYHTQKWEPGAYARIHSDNTDEHGNTGPFARSRYAAFLYLNDDFDGGLLKFPKQDLEIQPKTGMLAAFDGGFNNMHEVTLIKSGVRYTLGSFWDDREEDSYSQETRDLWAEEMKRIREAQLVEKTEWQDLLKQGWKIDEEGNKYKTEEIPDA